MKVKGSYGEDVNVRRERRERGWRMKLIQVKMFVFKLDEVSLESHVLARDERSKLVTLNTHHHTTTILLNQSSLGFERERKREMWRKEILYFWRGLLTHYLPDDDQSLFSLLSTLHPISFQYLYFLPSHPSCPLLLSSINNEIQLSTMKSNPLNPTTFFFLVSVHFHHFFLRQHYSFKTSDPLLFLPIFSSSCHEWICMKSETFRKYTNIWLMTNFDVLSSTVPTTYTTCNSFLPWNSVLISTHSPY